VRHGPDGIHQCGSDGVDPTVEEEEQCGVDLTAYTGAGATAWTR
jgi:hypothetical protein